MTATKPTDGELFEYESTVQACKVADARDQDVLTYEGTENVAPRSETPDWIDYFACPECGATVAEWCDCPECLWYDGDTWEAVYA